MSTKPYNHMILEAITHTKTCRKRVSKATITNYVKSNYDNVVNGSQFTTALRKTLKEGMKRDALIKGKTASQMISVYKPMIKFKMEQNISIRAEAAINLINTCTQTIINDAQSNNIIKLIESHNPSLNIPKFDLSALKYTAIQRLYSTVNEWKGLKKFKNKSNNVKSYKKNADNWWNRKKPDLLGEHFFYPLLHDVLPNYIKQYIVGSENISPGRYCNSDPMYLASYDLIYFSILYEIFHEEISFSRTKFLPFILSQCFIQSKCRHSLQQLLITLGEAHDIPWNNKGITKGDNARKYARKWVSDILDKIRISYEKVMNDSKPELEAYGCFIVAEQQSQCKPFLFKSTQYISVDPWWHRENNIAYDNNNNNNLTIPIISFSPSCQTNINNLVQTANEYNSLPTVTSSESLQSYSISTEPSTFSIDSCSPSTQQADEFPTLMNHGMNGIPEQHNVDSIFEQENNGALDQFDHNDQSFHFIDD